MLYVCGRLADSSTKVVVPLNILLSPTEKTTKVSSVFLNCFIDLRGLLADKVPLFVVTTSYPLREAIRPRLSITALSAISANEGS